ncbi:MAG: hypothetical protein P4L54_11645 [Acidocella sp.]|nr:hypothetical protein [Acidocella sp.]
MRPLGLLAFLALPLLSACSLKPIINHQVVDYLNVSAIASNQTILQNILRAKDGAPLHFGEFADIRGSLSINTSVSSTVPYGPIGVSKSTLRDALTAGAAISSSPSFDIDSLDTQDFTKGVMSPITPDTAEFFLNEGIDYRMVLMLLVSGVQPAGSDEMLLNEPNSSRIVCYKTPPGSNALPSNYTIIEAGASCAGTSEPEYYAFLRTINNAGRLYPVTAEGTPKLIGKPFNLDLPKDLRAIAAIDPTKYTMARTKNGQFQLMSATRKTSVVMCSDTGSGPQVVGVLASSVAQVPKVPEKACEPGNGASSEDDNVLPASAGPMKSVPVFKLRSTLEVIQYVGQVLAFQEQQTAAHPDLPERCITLEYEKLTGPTCNGGVLFHLIGPTPGPSLEQGNSVTYNGETWSLPDPEACTNPERCDHTLQTMSMISLLLNENKSAKDIGTTQAVQIVP